MPKGHTRDNCAQEKMRRKPCEEAYLIGSRGVAFSPIPRFAFFGSRFCLPYQKGTNVSRETFRLFAVSSGPAGAERRLHCPRPGRAAPARPRPKRASFGGPLSPDERHAAHPRPQTSGTRPANARGGTALGLPRPGTDAATAQVDGGGRGRKRRGAEAAEGGNDGGRGQHALSFRPPPWEGGAPGAPPTKRLLGSVGPCRLGADEAARTKETTWQNRPGISRKSKTPPVQRSTVGKWVMQQGKTNFFPMRCSYPKRCRGLPSETASSPIGSANCKGLHRPRHPAEITVPNASEAPLCEGHLRFFPPSPRCRIMHLV